MLVCRARQLGSACTQCQAPPVVRPAAEPHLKRLLGVEHLHRLIEPLPTKCQEPSIYVKGSNLFDELQEMGRVSCFSAQLGHCLGEQADLEVGVIDG